MWDIEAIPQRYYGERVDPEAVDEILFQRTLWAPDGDAAFHDGGHVFHFDVCDKVRLLGVSTIRASQKSSPNSGFKPTTSTAYLLLGGMPSSRVGKGR